MHQKVRDEAGEQRTRADGDEIGGGNGLECLGKRLDVGRHQEQLANFAVGGGDAGLAAYPRPVFELSFQFDRRGGGGIDASARQQDFGGKANGLGEISRDGGERRQEKIAEAVALQPGALLEAMLEESREQGLIFGKRDDPIAYVARREHVELFAEAAARTAIVTNGHHATQFADGGLTRSSQRRRQNITLESLQQRRQAGAAPDRN